MKAMGNAKSIGVVNHNEVMQDLRHNVNASMPISAQKSIDIILQCTEIPAHGKYHLQNLEEKISNEIVRMFRLNICL